MIIEEARDILQDQIDRYGQEYDAEGIEALEVAIKALEKYAKIADMLEGTIDHLNGDDAKDLLIDIKWEVRRRVKND